MSISTDMTIRLSQYSKQPMKIGKKFTLRHIITPKQTQKSYIRKRQNHLVSKATSKVVVHVFHEKDLTDCIKEYAAVVSLLSGTWFSCLSYFLQPNEHSWLAHLQNVLNKSNGHSSLGCV